MTSHTCYNTEKLKSVNQTDYTQSKKRLNRKIADFFTVAVMSLNTCFKKGTAVCIINTVIKTQVKC